jgi:phosphatidate cytidylyltransferase
LLLREIAELLGLAPGVIQILLGVTVFLLGATLFRGVALLGQPSSEEARKRLSSLVAWWVLHLLFVTILALGRPAVALGMFVISLLGLREALVLVSAPKLYPLMAFLTGLLYLWAWIDWISLFNLGIPFLFLLALPAALRRRPRGEGERVEGMFWLLLALWVAVAGPAFVVAVAFLPSPHSLPGNWAGWLVLLIVLTEMNDIAQAWWGRSFGTRPVAPSLSPAKTWEGVLGGMGTTLLLTLVLAPTLTPFGKTRPLGLEAFGPPWIWAGVLGIVVALAGIGGDLMASALKRRKGVKDSGALLPAQGGFLDRFDSLALTAPVFFLITQLLWTRTW